MEEYLKYGYELIALKPREKVPLEKGWRTAAPLTAAEAHAALRAGCNIGVRARGRDLIIDIDPRNGGSEDLLGIGRAELDRFPAVLTPSGGRHIYMRLPAPPSAGSGEFPRLRHTIPSMPGVEFKTLGRQVAAAGSTHPNGGIYEWDISLPALPAPLCPSALLEKIAAAEGLAASGGGAAPWSPARLAEALAALDPADFREHDAWLRLMMACHEATGGAGIEEFVSWSTGDELYWNAGPAIRPRWNSLRAGKEGNSGIGALRKILVAAGADASGLEGPAGADFEDLPPEEPPSDSGKGRGASAEAGAMAKLDAEFSAVDEDGRLKVFAQRRDDALGRSYWVRYERRAFLEVCKSVLKLPAVEIGSNAKGEPKFADAGLFWIDSWPKKKAYRGVAFAPEHSGDRTPDGRLNLWRGFAFEPSGRGSWEMLKELLWESLCGMDGKSYEYVMNWMARAVQRPWEPGGVALVFKGAKGTGKGTLGRAFAGLFGRHGLHITSPSLLVGRFNAHLRDCCALFADEAFWAGDKASEGVLKGLVTEPTVQYEGKGQNAETGRNCVHILMAANGAWVVPAGMDNERRFAAFDVADAKHPAAYWARLRKEEAGGGGARMLRDLLDRDISNFNVFASPNTKALALQKLQTMGPIEQWLYELALSGDWSGVQNYKPGSAPGGEALLLTEDVHMSYQRFCSAAGHRNFSARASETQLGLAVRALVPEVGKRRILMPTFGRQRYFYSFPPSSEVVRRFEGLLGFSQQELES